MKTLVLVRHAKSSWKDPSLEDIARPLNKRGKRDAPLMSRHLYSTGVRPELIVCSPSRRTRDTAAFFKKQFDWKEDQFVVDQRLYHGDVFDINEVLSGLGNEFEQVMIFVHNPGITAYINQESNLSVSNIPTCGVVVLDSEVSSWSNFTTSNKEVRYSFYPKRIILQ